MFVSPVLILVIWIFTLYDYEAPSYGDYSYPWWCILLGWCIAALSILPIPIMAVIAIISAEGKTFLDKIKNAASPKMDETDINLKAKEAYQEQFKMADIKSRL